MFFFLHVQPSEIMEWIPDEEYDRAENRKSEKSEKEQKLEAQIAELQAKLKRL